MRDFLKCRKCNKKMHKFTTLIKINDTHVVTHYCKNENCDFGIGYEIKNGKIYPAIIEKAKDDILRLLNL